MASLARARCRRAVEHAAATTTPRRVRTLCCTSPTARAHPPSRAKAALPSAFYGVPPAALRVPLDGSDILLARQLVGVAAIKRGVYSYTLAEQTLSPAFTARMVNAMKGGGHMPPLPPEPPARPPAKPTAAEDATAAAAAAVSRRWTPTEPPATRAAVCAQHKAAAAAAPALFPALEALANGKAHAPPANCDAGAPRAHP
eukprot:4638389-Prymnesium_polylepis.1